MNAISTTGRKLSLICDCYTFFTIIVDFPFGKASKTSEYISCEGWVEVTLTGLATSMLSY